MLYTVMIYGVDGVFERLPQEEQNAHLATHGKVQQMLKDKGTYFGAARLMPSSTAMNVGDSGSGVTITDGPFAETKEQLAGFYMFEAETMEEALEVAKELPQGIAQMEVRPVMWASDFKNLS